MVEPAEERPLKVGASVLQAGDLLVEGLEAAPADGLPLVDGGGVDDSADVVEGESGLLQHADEDQQAQRGGAVAALAR